MNGFILVGGKSKRMGRDKALIHYRKKPLILRIASLLEPFVDDVTLLGPPARYKSFGLPVLADQWPDQGPLAAVGTGLLATNAEWNIFFACDLPLVSGGLIQYLVRRAARSKGDAVVPRIQNVWQPLLAAYHVRCREPIVRAIEAGRRSFFCLMDEVRVEEITLNEMRRAGLSGSEFSNMNTPEDMKRIKKSSKGVR